MQSPGLPGSRNLFTELWTHKYINGTVAADICKPTGRKTRERRKKKKKKKREREREREREKKKKREKKKQKKKKERKTCLLSD